MKNRESTLIPLCLSLACLLMLFNSVVNLSLENGLFISSSRFTDAEFYPIGKDHDIKTWVNFTDLIFLIIYPAGLIFQRVTHLHRDDLLFDGAIFHQLVNRHLGRDFFLFGMGTYEF